jgi:hypothetical protein
MTTSVEELVVAARAALGDGPFDEQWTTGQALTADEAVELALAGP